MNRAEFMRQLEVLLKDISPSERVEALQYYNDYFNDAGVENENDVIRALGTPAKVAETIKTGLNEKMQANYEFTDTGFKTGNEKNYNEVMQNKNTGYNGNNSYGSNANGNVNYGNTAGNGNHQKASGNSVNNTQNNTMLILIVIGLVVLFPVWFPTLLTVLGALFGLIAAAFGIWIAMLVGGFCLIIAAIFLFVVALVKLPVAPIGSICLIGASFVLAGIGILLFAFSIWFVVVVVPPLVRGIVVLCKKPFQKNR
ncbi:MAG: DUF1700 domain-containing protein [Clostridiales bacterium]|nr:DUF1700 domain-containing protein [Clostridiales bacterium]